MIKLWNHGLLDAGTMDNCNLILDRYRNGGLDGVKNSDQKGIPLAPKESDKN